jgi:hypothetical protein
MLTPVTTRNVLAAGEIYELVSDGRVLTCEVVNRAEVTAEVGARCAREMDELIGRELLGPAARHRGLVFDVRQGPIAFGPKTRTSLAAMFGAAERGSLRVAALVGDSPTQMMQFANLRREVAPNAMVVTRSPEEARAWVAGGASR